MLQLNSPHTWLSLVLTVINLLWSMLNLKMQSNFERRMRELFYTKPECDLKHQLYAEIQKDLNSRLAEIRERLARAGA